MLYMSEKKNWDKIRNQPLSDSVRYRDVYEDQQLDRSKIEEKQSPLSRIIFSVVMGILIAFLVYFIYSCVELADSYIDSMNTSSSVSSVTDDAESDYYITRSAGVATKYRAIDKNGKPFGEWVFDLDEIEIPKWSRYYENPEGTTDNTNKNNSSIALSESFRPKWLKVLVSLIAGALGYFIIYQIMMRNLEAQNMMNDTSDINQYQNDQHIALPEEVQTKFDWFPDVGAHSNVQVSSMISHMALKNKGLKSIEVTKRAKKDILDEDGDIEYYKGEALCDDDGNIITETKPMIDTDFMEALFEASGAPDDKNIRKYYDATKIMYNPDNKDRDKQKDCNTVADLINKDWTLPAYETSRPAGAYIVDTAPVNTMVLAITRAGKGQTVIEPTIDMWTREKRPNNMVINDPKGELLVKNYVRGTVRGFQIVQFNLINAMKTDIYNPLCLAADAAREGDFTKVAMYVENIADVFFPVDGAEDPVWPNAANNAFKRAAYGLIDYYLEEEKELRLFAERTNMDPKILEGKIDAMWGKVTLYNTYQLFVQLTSKKLKNPAVEFAKKAKAGEFDNISDEEYQEKLELVEAQSVMWEDKPEIDLLTLFFNATDALPKNSMRTLVSNANNALRAMSGAEKMMAS